MAEEHWHSKSARVMGADKILVDWSQITKVKVLCHRVYIVYNYDILFFTSQLTLGYGCLFMVSISLVIQMFVNSKCFDTTKCILHSSVQLTFKLNVLWKFISLYILLMFRLSSGWAMFSHITIRVGQWQSKFFLFHCLLILL